MSIVKEAWPFVLPMTALAVVALVLGLPILATVLVLLALAIAWFFRDPRRDHDGPPELVTAAADGVVTVIDEVDDPDVGSGTLRRVVTFLSVFDVHVQRAPVEGRVVNSLLTRGRKVAAYREDAGAVNENQLTVLERTEGDRVGIRQIAGLVARRVVPYLGIDDQVRRGEHLGVIKFGSRVDVILPESYEVLVRVGERMRAGETPLAMPTDPSTAPPPLDANATGGPS